MKKIRRFDGVSKVEGSCLYTDDYQLDNFLYGRIFFSPVSHGKIKSISFPDNIDEFTYVDHKSILGKNIVPEPEPDQVLFPTSEITYQGQPIFAVAHKNREKIDKLFDEVIIDFEELPAITSPEEALANGKKHIGKELKIIQEKEIDLSSCIVFKREYTTQHQEQLYLEPQSMIAEYHKDSETIAIKGSMQCPYFVKETLEMIFGNIIKHVVVETAEGIGGAFGGKEDYPNIVSAIAALLAYKSNSIVKIIYDRETDIRFSTKRHPSRTKIKAWVDCNSFHIKKINIDFRLDAGAFQTLSPVVLSRGILHSTGGYFFPNAELIGRLFRSNTPPNGAFRGFGAPQSIFAIEAFMEEIADSLKISPYEFRKANVHRTGTYFPTGQKITNNNLEDCLDDVVFRSDFQNKLLKYKKCNELSSRKFKGIGLSLGLHGGGYTGNGEKFLNSQVKMVINQKRCVEIYVSNVEMGQGAHTSLAKLVAEEFKTEINNVKVMIPNTDLTPNSGPTVASRTIYIVGNLLRKLVKEILNEEKVDSLEEYLGKNFDLPKEFRKNFEADPSVDFNEKTYQGIAYKDFSWAACVAEVEVDKITFEVELKDIWTTLDIGKVADVEIAEGQVYGGLTQGIGYAMSEYFHKKDIGRAIDITQYIVPTSNDLSDMKIKFIHTNEDLAKGLGEIPMDFPAPAIRNAIAQAVSVFVNNLPVTPEKIFNQTHKGDTR